MEVREARRLNLIEHIANTYQGNRAAFSRATGKNPNLINLVLSNNKEFARPIGEKLARDLEIKAHLPKGWLDSPRGIGERKSVFIPVVTGALLPKEQPPNADYSFTLPLDDPMLSLRLSGTANLVVYVANESTMTPTFDVGDYLWIDLGVKQYDGDGVYAIVSDNVKFRRIQKISDTQFRMSTDNKVYDPITYNGKDKKKPVICGRVMTCSRNMPL